jgi:hypothetical protein
MAAQGDHVDCARLLLYHRAPVDDVTVVRMSQWMTIVIQFYFFCVQVRGIIGCSSYVNVGGKILWIYPKIGFH